MSNSSSDPSSHSSSDSSSVNSVKITNVFSDLLLKKKRIGFGGFASVFRCVHTLDGKEYAVKRIGVKHKNYDWSLQEVRALSSLKHDNVVRYYQSWTDVSWGSSSRESSRSDSEVDSRSDSEGDSEGSPEEEECDLYLYIQMEFCPRTLEKKLKKEPINSYQALLYFRDLLLGLSYIHDTGYLHRDLTMKNIFIGTDKAIKIGDFGLAKETKGPEDNRHCSHSRHTTSIGVPRYRAPELSGKEPYPYSEKSDLYSLGIIFFEMLLPPNTNKFVRSNSIMEVRKGVFPKNWENRFETSIIRLMLAKSPASRPTVKEVLHMIGPHIAAKSEC